MLSRPQRLALLLLLAATAARVGLQVLAMPPYAGLDELYHVARLAFTFHEGRNPHSDEPSIPCYLGQTLARSRDVPPSFAALGERWPEYRKQHPPPWPNPTITPSLARPCGDVNYESQHPSLYYSVVSHAASLLPRRTPLAELTVWRLASVVFALVAVAAAGLAAQHWFGEGGILAAVLLSTAPTWLTLVARASNDALACALLAAALLATARSRRRWTRWVAEGLLWAAAVATKLYTWPVLAVLPVLWRWQRAPWRRVIVVAVCVALALVAVAFDLLNRTGTPLGLQELQHTTPRAATERVAIDFGQIFRVFVASAVWPGGHHGNALTPIAMLLFGGPILATAAVLAAAAWRSKRVRHAGLIAAIATGAFLLAQGVQLYGFIRRAVASGESMPEGGMAGWYVYSLLPVAAVLAAGLLRYARPALVFAITGWLLLWDLLIHEGALFRDYLGLTGPSSSSLLFRWGPSPLLQLDALEPELLILRLLHLVAVLALALLTVEWLPGTVRGPAAPG